MQFTRSPEKKTQNSKKRSRWLIDPIYFNPPYSVNVDTDIGKKFLQLVDKYFPKDGKYRKALNRHTLKLSYSCMNNLGKEISSHNNKILNDKKESKSIPGCNCRSIECPLDNHCLVPCCVYQGLLSSVPSKPS